MRKTLFISLILLMQTLVLVAQPKGYKTVADQTAFKQKYTKAASGISSIKSDFRQEKNMAMLEEKINSSGLFYFEKSKKVRMEYTQPYKYLLIINQDKILIQDQSKKNTFSSGDNKLFKQINRVIVDCVQGRILDNKDFQVKTYENNKLYCLDMVPQTKEMKQMFQTIRLFVNKSDFSIDQLVMMEAGGDNTTMTFTNKQLNTDIKDALFEVK